jgi:5-formyltetrahydrofolate cyclo-ligase
MSDELKRAKRELRRRILAVRDALPDAERDRIADVVASRVLALPELVDATVVLGFWSFGSEVPTAPLLAGLAESGRRVVLPRIDGADLELRTWSPGEPLSESRFGAQEPVGGLVVTPGELDAIVTPAVAFDRDGGRVGYGGGFYDRLFRRTRPDAMRVGVAAAVQLVDDPLPCGPSDVPVHVVVTETEIVRPRGGT